MFDEYHIYFKPIYSIMNDNTIFTMIKLKANLYRLCVDEN